MVKDFLAERGISYESVLVPAERSARSEVMAISGQPFVPVLVDGDVVLDDENEILKYLQQKY